MAIGGSTPVQPGLSQPNAAIRPGGPAGQKPAAAVPSKPRREQKGGGDEHPQPLTSMLDAVHGMLSKMGKGLPGFTESQGVEGPSAGGGLQSPQGLQA